MVKLILSATPDAISPPVGKQADAINIDVKNAIVYNSGFIVFLVLVLVMELIYKALVDTWVVHNIENTHYCNNKKVEEHILVLGVGVLLLHNILLDQ
jgi:hypothetical protein